MYNAKGKHRGGDTLRRLEGHLVHVNEILYPLQEKVSRLERQLHDKWNTHSLLPPVLPQRHNGRTFNAQTTTVRDDLRNCPHYVAYPRRSKVFTVHPNQSFVSRGTWVDSKSREFDLCDLKTSGALHYKRFPKLKNDVRPTWKL